MTDVARIVGTIATLFLALMASSVNAFAEDVYQLFGRNDMEDIYLSINERDLRELRDRYQESVYFPADLQWRGVQVQNIGVRSRGMSSRSAVKPGLKLDFNQYVTGQRFLGMESLVLDNLVTDPSMVREVLAMRMFDRLGEPALRESFARLYINRAYQGLYVIVEPVNKDFLSRIWSDRRGYLFERQFNSPFYGEDLGDDEAAWRAVFEPRTHEREAGTILYDPIRSLFREVNQPSDGVWRDAVERYLDLRQFVSHVAIETFLAEADGVLGYAGMANFFLYRPAEGTRHRFIVWDKDHAFWALDSPIFPPADENVLFRRAIAFDDLRTLYLDMLEWCARLAATDGWLEREIDGAASLIAEAARQDAAKPYSDEEHETALGFLRTFARERPAFVLQAVARAREGR